MKDRTQRLAASGNRLDAVGNQEERSSSLDGQNLIRNAPGGVRPSWVTPTYSIHLAL